MEELSGYAAQQYAEISENPAEPFAIRYAGPLAETDTPYRDMLAGLERTRKDDLQRGYTHFGPHRDDVALLLFGRDLRAGTDVPLLPKFLPEPPVLLSAQALQRRLSVRHVPLGLGAERKVCGDG